MHLLVERHTAGNHLLPRLRGIAAIREQQHVATILTGNLHSTESVAVTRDVNHLHAAVAKEVEGLLGWTFCTVPLDGLQINTLPPLLIADEAVLAGSATITNC